jgi:hypothetical protein
MPLPFDPHDQRKLVELAYLGEWLVNAHHAPEHQDEVAAKAIQQLLAQVELGDAVGRDVETGEYYLDEGWAERLYNDYIADYDDHIFWDELTERLAQRDLARQRDISPEEISRDDDLSALKPIEEHYRHELEANGIDHLEMTDHD